MNQLKYSSLKKEDFPALKIFSDRWIGKDYYTLESLEKVLGLSTQKELNASFICRHQEEIVGIRFTYAPGRVFEEGIKLTPSLWKVEQEKVAYFKSLFIAEKFQRQGIGKEMSFKSFDILKKMGAKAIVCHSWLESPGNTSQIYLKGMGFSPLVEHKNYWSHLDYDCLLCSPSKCSCTSIEMIKFL